MLTITNYESIIGDGIGDWKIITSIESPSYYIFDCVFTENADAGIIQFRLDREKYNLFPIDSKGSFIGFSNPPTKYYVIQGIRKFMENYQWSLTQSF